MRGVDSCGSHEERCFPRAQSQDSVQPNYSANGLPCSFILSSYLGNWNANQIPQRAALALYKRDVTRGGLLSATAHSMDFCSALAENRQRWFLRAHLKEALVRLLLELLPHWVEARCINSPRASAGAGPSIDFGQHVLDEMALGLYRWFWFNAMQQKHQQSVTPKRQLIVMRSF